MSTPIRWIKQQLARAQRDLEEAQRRVTTWTEALRLVREEKEEIPPAGGHATNEGNSQLSRRPRAGRIIDKVDQILKEHGPAKAAQIQQRLEEIGITTSANSVNTSLNRFRPNRFDRNQEGKWFLVVENKSDSEDSKVALE